MTTPPLSASWDSEIGQQAIDAIRRHMLEIARMFACPTAVTVFVHFPDSDGADLLLTTADSLEAATVAMAAHCQRPEATPFDLPGEP